MQPENYIWQLIARSLSNEASPEEIILLDEHLKKDELLQQRYNVLKHYWCFVQPADISADNENQKQIARILEKAGKADAADSLYKKRRLFRRRILVVSIVAFLVISTAAIYFISNRIENKSDSISQAPTDNSHQLITRNGNRTRNVLPDGSVVWLNAGSTLTYNNFRGKTRQVYLKGEAFFDVTKDAAHPFIVHANSVDIKVLGTAFNVKSYSDENKVEATLIRGVIQVTRQNEANQKVVFLHPNEKLVIDLKENTLIDKPKKEAELPKPVFKILHLDSTVKAENLVETSWVYNKLEFHGEDFEELAKKLERWYNIKIVFEDENVKSLHLTGSFEKETVQEAFEALKAAVPFDYTINQNEVFISSISKNVFKKDK